jgi:hypothetical protein
MAAEEQEHAALLERLLEETPGSLDATVIHQR